MSGQSGIVPLFATPFVAVNTGADRHFNARLASLCESQRPAPADDFLASADPTAGELRRLVLGQASAVIAGLSSLGAAEFARLHIQARGWCSVVPRDGHVPAQHFPGASWLAVYCVQAGETDAGFKSAGVLRLYERRLGSIYRDASTSELKSPFRYGNHTWSPVPGWMALFPAHVPHEVSVVRSITSLILVFAMIRFTEADAHTVGSR
jgi:hypothetical protein